jgi:hypothetical protein
MEKNQKTLVILLIVSQHSPDNILIAQLSTGKERHYDFSPTRGSPGEIIFAKITD